MEFLLVTSAVLSWVNVRVKGQVYPLGSLKVERMLFLQTFHGSIYLRGCLWYLKGDISADSEKHSIQILV